MCKDLSIATCGIGPLMILTRRNSFTLILSVPSQRRSVDKTWPWGCIGSCISIGTEPVGGRHLLVFRNGTL